jgi:hypothetical protein
VIVKPRTMGLTMGLLLSALSWLGNSRRVDTFTVSAFPDLITVFALPILIYFALRLGDRQEPGRDLGRLRRAGWASVNAASAVFAIFMACFAAFQLDQATPAVVASSLVTALIVSAGLGYLSVEVWARSIVRARRV